MKNPFEPIRVFHFQRGKKRLNIGQELIRLLQLGLFLIEQKTRLTKSLKCRRKIRGFHRSPRRELRVRKLALPERVPRRLNEPWKEGFDLIEFRDAADPVQRINIRSVEFIIKTGLLITFLPSLGLVQKSTGGL